MKLKQELILGLTESGYTVPTPIQEESIPIIQEGKSLIARAKNGTGKTAAFVIPLLDEIDEKVSAIQGNFFTLIKASFLSRPDS